MKFYFINFNCYWQLDNFTKRICFILSWAYECI